MSSTRNTNLGLLILRLGFSGLMLTHGYPKLMKIFKGDLSFGNPIGIGPELSLLLTVFAEFLCPVLIILGIRTRLAAVPPIVVMLVAVFAVHWNDPFGKIEFAMLYLLGFLAIALMGAGKYTLRRML